MDRNDFLSKLKLVKPLVSSSSIMPVYKFFLFEDGNVVATNSFQNACVSLDSGLNGLVDPDSCIKLLDTYSSDEMDIRQVKDKAHIVIGDNSSISLSVVDSDNFVFEEPDLTGMSIDMTGEFVTGLKKVLFSVNKDGNFPINRGVVYTGKHFYSSDSSERMSSYYLGGDSIDPILLPELFCKSILTFVGMFGFGALIINEDTVIANFEDNYVSTVIDTDIDFIPFDTIFESILGDTKIAGYDSNELVNVIKRHVILSGSNNNLTSVHSDIAENRVEFCTKSNNSRVDDEMIGIPFVSDNKDNDTFAFKINPKLLLEGLKNTENAIFKVSAEENEPIAFIGTKDNFTHIVSSVA